MDLRLELIAVPVLTRRRPSGLVLAAPSRRCAGARVAAGSCTALRHMHDTNATTTASQPWGGRVTSGGARMPDAKRCRRCGEPADLLAADPDLWLCRRCADELGRTAIEGERKRS